MKVLISTLVALLTAYPLLSQDLFKQQIRKVQGSKKSAYFKGGIIHNGKMDHATSLNAIRHSFVPRRGYERVVFDFEGRVAPRLYGLFSPDENKLYLDFYKTNIKESMDSFGNSRFVDSVSFFPLSKDSLSIEIHFKERVQIEAFTLKGGSGTSGRLVLDLKN